MFGFLNKGEIEDQMAEWLAHPNEFGVRPRTIKYKRTFKGTLVGQGKVKIHLVEYVMPDGTKGRGFVNGSLTWAFLGDNINDIEDNDLLLGYCGWATLFPLMQSGGAQTKFISNGEEACYVALKQSQGVSDVKIVARYKIGDAEFFEFTGTADGQSVKGAGNTEADITFNADQPQYHLPQIYFLLGFESIDSMK